MGFSVEVWWGALSVEGKKLDCGSTSLSGSQSLSKALQSSVEARDPPYALVELIQIVSTSSVVEYYKTEHHLESKAPQHDRPQGIPVDVW